MILSLIRFGLEVVILITFIVLFVIFIKEYRKESQENALDIEHDGKKN